MGLRSTTPPNLDSFDQRHLHRRSKLSLHRITPQTGTTKRVAVPGISAPSSTHCPSGSSSFPIGFFAALRAVLFAGPVPLNPRR